MDSGGCNGKFCSKCLNFAIVTENDTPSGKITTFCKHCFKLNSSLDFGNYYEILGPPKHDAPAILFVHSNGSCRKSFLPHARILSLKYRCVLLDLPGHGGNLDDVLSMYTATSIITSITIEQCGDYKGIRPVYIGAGLGAYIGMDIIGRSPNHFSGAILTSCGQDVGQERTLSSTAALSLFSPVLALTTSALQLQGLSNLFLVNTHIPRDIQLEIHLRCGIFFGQSNNQMKLMSQSNPRITLPLFPGPILFINGSKDFRDGETEWVKFSQKGSLHIYEGGDVFVIHDDRFMTDYIDKIDKFMQELSQ